MMLCNSQIHNLLIGRGSWDGWSTRHCDIIIIIVIKNFMQCHMILYQLSLIYMNAVLFCFLASDRGVWLYNLLTEISAIQFYTRTPPDQSKMNYPDVWFSEPLHCKVQVLYISGHLSEVCFCHHSVATYHRQKLSLCSNCPFLFKAFVGSIKRVQCQLDLKHQGCCRLNITSLWLYFNL